MLHRLSVPSLTLSMKQYDDSLVRVKYLLQVPAVSALMVIVLMQAEFQHAQRHAAAKQIQGAITLRASPCVHHPACIALRAPSLAPRSGVVTARLSRSAATTMRREKEAEAATQINGLVRSRDIAKVGGSGTRAACTVGHHSISHLPGLGIWSSVCPALNSALTGLVQSE